MRKYACLLIIAILIASLAGCELQQKKKDSYRNSNFSAQPENRIPAVVNNERPRLVVQTGHSAVVNVVKWSRDGNTFFSGSLDRTIRVWDRQGHCINTLEGHADNVISLAISPDGNTLASGSDDGMVRLWDSGGIPVKILDGHESYVRSIAFRPDGNMLASGSDDKTIRLWDKQGNLIKKLVGHAASVEVVAFSPDGNILASGSEDGTIRLWYIDGQRTVVLKGHSGGVYALAFSPDGNTLASGSRDNTLRIWGREGNLVKTLEGHTGYVNVLVFSADGEMLASGSDDKTVRLWDRRGNFTRTLSGHTVWVRALAFSPDGNILASGSADHTVRLWGKDGNHVATLEGHTGEIVTLGFSPDGNILVTGSSDDTVRLWDRRGNPIKTLEGRSDLVRTLDFDPGGNMIAAGYYDSRVRLWDVHGYLKKILVGHTAQIVALAFSPDGSSFATASDDATVRLWDLQGKLINTMRGHTRPVTVLVYSPDGNMIATGSDDRTVRLWDKKGKTIKVLNGHTDYVRALAWSPDGKTLASGSHDKTVRMWDRDGKNRKILKGHWYHINALVFSPDGGILASGSSDNTARLWDKNGNVINILKGHTSDVWALAFSPDGKTLASGSFDHAVCLWDRKGNLLKTLKGHRRYIDTLCFSPDGSMLASGAGDNTIILWYTRGNHLKTMEGHTAAVTTMGFSSDDTCLASGSVDGSIRIWNFRTGSLMATLLAFKEGNGLVYTPDYHYRLSGDATGAVAFAKGMKAYGFDQFDLRFNRPDIVLERLVPEAERTQETKDKISLYREYWEKRAALNGIDPKALTGETKIHAPDVYDIRVNGTKYEDMDTTLKDGKVKLSFKIKDEDWSGLPVIGYRIFVNGVPLYGQTFRRFKTQKKVQDVKDVEIILSAVSDIGSQPGANKIEISGLTSDYVESRKEPLFLTYAGTDKDTKGNLYIVSLGIDDYKKAKGFESLSYAAKDSREIVSTFEKSGKKKYDKIITLPGQGKSYTNAQVNRDALKQIKDTLAQTSVDDTVIFFMAGHGVRKDTPAEEVKDLASLFGTGGELVVPKDEKGNESRVVNVYYYMTGDSDVNRPWEKAIPLDAVRSVLDGIPARQKILLIDTCQSGEKMELASFKPSKETLEAARSDLENMLAANTDKVAYKVRGIASTWSRDEMLLLRAKNLAMKELSDMFPELRRGTGTIEISAATGAQSAWEGKLPSGGKIDNGAFTWVVKEAVLEGKARNKDGAVTARSLRSYVLDRVEKITRGYQTPMVCRDIPGRDFEVVR